MRNPVTLESPMFLPRQSIAVVSWLAALAFGPPATAAIVNYNFSVELTSGPLAPKTFSGSFAFDDAAPPTPGFGGEDLYELSAFSFDFAGVPYALGDLDYGDAVFLAGQFIGLEAGNAAFSFLPATGGSPPLFPPAFFYVIGPQQSGDGNPSFVQVPEPAGGLLAAAAIGAMWVGRRRQPTRG
jgi:hypothetical protein